MDIGFETPTLYLVRKMQENDFPVWLALVIIVVGCWVGSKLMRK